MFGDFFLKMMNKIARRRYSFYRLLLTKVNEKSLEVLNKYYDSKIILPDGCSYDNMVQIGLNYSFLPVVYSALNTLRNENDFLDKQSTMLFYNSLRMFLECQNDGGTIFPDEAIYISSIPLVYGADNSLSSVVFNAEYNAVKSFIISMFVTAKDKNIKTEGLPFNLLISSDVDMLKCIVIRCNHFLDSVNGGIVAGV